MNKKETLPFLPVLLVVCMGFCGCGPTKDELLALAPYLTAATIAVSCAAELLRRRVIVYTAAFLLAAALFGTVLAFELGGNQLFLFSIIMMPFIAYAGTIHGLARLIRRNEKKVIRRLLVPALSACAVSAFYCVFVALNAKPNGDIGDATANLFGWPFFLLEALGNICKALFGG